MNQEVILKKEPVFNIRFECASCSGILTINEEDTNKTRICPICKSKNWKLQDISWEDDAKARDLLEYKRYRLRACYFNILALSSEFIDMRENDRKIKALWIIGSFCYRLFQTFPYLYYNAMKGSAKTRTENFIAALTGTEVYSGITESGIFRHDPDKPLILDEVERVQKKDYQAVREFLNVAYKKGGMVKRQIKTKEGNAEVYKSEKIDAFRPVVIANINGMDDVLGDRCLASILERSNRTDVTKMLEIFSTDPRFSETRAEIQDLVLFVKCSYTAEYMILWNKFVQSLHFHNSTSLSTQTTSYTYTTLSAQITLQKEENTLMKLLNGGSYEDLFKKIDALGITSRSLELIFPLLLIAHFLGNDILEDALVFLKESIEMKKDRDSIEDKDISVIDFVAQECGAYRLQYTSLKNLVYSFKAFIGESPDEEMWLNERWLGRALVRLNLITSRRRTGRGSEVMLAVDKAKEKIKMFRAPEEKTKNDN